MNAKRTKRLLLWLTILALLVTSLSFFGCRSGAKTPAPDAPAETQLTRGEAQTAEREQTETAPPRETSPPVVTETEPVSVDDDPQPPETTQAAEETTAGISTEPPTETTAQEDLLSEDAYYYTKDEVALYLHTFGHLPKNYITKSEAQALGWDAAKGNLWDVADGFCIGGDRFGNYEGLLPKKGNYKEADVDYTGGYRGADRLIFDTKGGIWYTGDHYKTFEKLY